MERSTVIPILTRSLFYFGYLGNSATETIRLADRVSVLGYTNWGLSGRASIIRGLVGQTIAVNAYPQNPSPNDGRDYRDAAPRAVYSFAMNVTAPRLDWAETTRTQPFLAIDLVATQASSASTTFVAELSLDLVLWNT